MRTKRIPRRYLVTLGLAWTALLLPRPLSGQQGAPSSLREPSSRSSIDVEMLAEEQYRLGLAYLKSPESAERAVEHLEKAVELNRGNAEFHFRLAEAYGRDFSYASILRKPFIAAKMKTQLEFAVRYNPGSIEFREALIQYYLLAPSILGGSYSKAIEQAEAMKAYDPYFSTLAMANIQAEEGEHEKANAYYIRAIQMRPTAWQAYQRYGAYCLSVQEVDRAIQLFGKYVSLKPDTSASYENLASAFVRKRMYTEGISAYLKAVEKDPSLTHLVFRAAQLCEFKGDRNAALGFYQKYLSLSPTGSLADDARTRIQDLQR